MREPDFAAQTAMCLRLTHLHHDHTFDVVHRHEFYGIWTICVRPLSVEHSYVIAKAPSENSGWASGACGWITGYLETVESN